MHFPGEFQASVTFLSFDAAHQNILPQGNIVERSKKS